jgi:hypothetical protein
LYGAVGSKDVLTPQHDFDLPLQHLDGSQQFTVPQQAVVEQQLTVFTWQQLDVFPKLPFK